MSGAAKSNLAEPHYGSKVLHGYWAVPIDWLREKAGPDYEGEFYGTILDGKCLEPEVPDGSQVIAAPGATYAPGDFVVLWFADATKRPMIKRVVMCPPADWKAWLNPESDVMPLIVVEMLNPPQRFVIPMDHLSAVDRVLATFEPGTHERVPTPRRQNRKRVRRS